MSKTFIVILLICVYLTSCSVNGGTSNSTAAAGQTQSSDENTTSYPESSSTISEVIENSEPLVSEDTSKENFAEPTCIHGSSLPGTAFHEIPLTNDSNSSLLTPEEYEKWTQTEQKEKYWIDGCVYDLNGKMVRPHNIAEYIREFKISRKDLERNYYELGYYSVYIDFDVLYRYSYQDTSKWYLDEWDKAAAKVMPEILLEENLKEVLFKKAGVNTEGKLMINYSIPQIIYDNKISKETIATTLEYIDSLGKRRFEYNLDLIYNKDSAILEALEKVKKGELYPVQVDEMIRVNSPQN